MAEDRIVLLDENTANRIAAGEVVERPASAVKELVENAIDSGADRIVVSLVEGGKQRITVADNGCGMTRNDAVMALQRHATSKIRSSEDLFDIHTLGFRGEALPSIASVSRFKLTTKPVDHESGFCLTIENSEIKEIEEVAARDGTEIEVGDLFYNTPARLKFMKSTPTELSRVIEMCGTLAIAYPQVGLKVLNNGQEVMRAPGTGELLDALAAVWGREPAKKMIPISYQGADIRVEGYVSTPETTRPGRSHELFFVNHRPIKSRVLGHALEEAFRSLTPESRYPLAAIFLEIDPSLVDVNVHPTKTEVKFTRDPEAHHAVSEAVKAGLLAYGIVPQARLSNNSGRPAWNRTAPVSTDVAGSLPSNTDPGSEVDRSPGAFWRGATPGGFTTSSDFRFKLPEPPPGRSAMPDESPPAPVYDPSDPFADPPASPTDGEAGLTPPVAPKPFAEQLREFKVIGQARNTYIIALTPDGIAVVDQHVAHERVLYERLTVKRFSAGIPSQGLAVPATLNLDRRSALMLRDQCDTFKESGWDIEPFGGESFVIRAIPATLVGKNYEAILQDMVDELVNQSVARRLLVMKDYVTITNSCKMAVKAGDPLSVEEMESLLSQLADTENPYLCPHGRPIVVMIPFKELDKQFKRS